MASLIPCTGSAGKPDSNPLTLTDEGKSIMENTSISYFTEGKTHKERMDNYTDKLSSGELPNDLNSDELKVLKYIFSSPEGMIMMSKAVHVPLLFLLGGDENDPFYKECIEWAKAHGEYKEP